MAPKQNWWVPLTPQMTSKSLKPILLIHKSEQTDVDNCEVASLALLASRMETSPFWSPLDTPEWDCTQLTNPTAQQETLGHVQAHGKYQVFYT